MNWIKEKWLLITTTIIYFIIVFTPLVEYIAFIPDIFGLSKFQSTQDFFGLIIGAIASIFGILMAVIILSVEFFKERLNKNNYQNPLDNSLIKNSIYLSVSLISLSFLSYLLINKFDTSKHLTVGYYIAILFVFYIYSLFPFLKNIVNKSSQIKQVLEIAESLKLNDFKEVSKYRYDAIKPDAELRKLKKEIDFYILENNVLSYENISNRILDKVLLLISDGKSRNDCDTVLNALTWLWRENCKTAIRVNDSQYFDLVWSSINILYLYAAEKKIDLLYFYEIESFIHFEIKSLYNQFKNTLSLSNGLDAIENGFNANIIKNCPKQEDIWDLMNLYEKVDGNHPSYHNNSSQWDHLKNILNYTFRIQDIAIDLNDTELFEECNQRINTICSHIAFNFNNLGGYQKGYLIWRTLTQNYFQSSVALEKEVYNTTLDCFKVHRHIIANIIDKKTIHEKDIRIVITTLGDYLFVALKNKKLHINYDYGTFGDFCRIGIHSIKRYNQNKIDKNVVDYFVKYIKYLKNYVEGVGIDNFEIEYKNIKRALKHFINVAVDFDGFNEDQKPVKKWKKIYDKFEIRPEKSEDFGIVKWKVQKQKNIGNND